MFVLFKYINGSLLKGASVLYDKQGNGEGNP